MILMNKLLKIDAKKKFASYLKAPVAFRGSESRNLYLLFLLTIFGILILAYVLYFTKRIPLFTLLIEGDSEQANIDRTTSRRNFEGIVYIKNLLGLIVVPVIAYFSYIQWRARKKTIFFIFFIINLLVAVIMVSHDVQKAPIAFFVVGLAIAEAFVSKGISPRKFIIFVMVPVGLIIIGYVLTSERDAFDQLFRYNSSFYGRTFLTGYFGFPLSLELFPEVITQPTHMVGVPTAILGDTHTGLQESARLLKMYTHPETIAAGTGNLYSGFFMGEAWANYGYLGLIIAPTVVGLVIQTVHLFLLTHQKNPWLLAFYVAVTVKWVVSAGFVNFFYLKLLLWPLLLYAISNFFIKRILNHKA